MVVVSHFNDSYLPQGIVLIRSVLKHFKNVNVYIYAHDEETSRELVHQFGNQVTVLDLSQLIDGNIDLKAAWYSTNRSERFFLLSPYTLLDIFDRTNCSFAIYLDADIMLFKPIARELLQNMSNCDLGLTTHYLSERDSNLARFGLYNVGWITVRNSPKGREFLNWWSAKCSTSVSTSNPNSSVFGDQKYLDQVQYLGIEVAKLDSHFVNVGPWSDIDSDSLGRIQSFHFSRARLSKLLFILGTSFHRTEKPHKKLKKIYAEYRKELEIAYAAIGIQIPLLPTSLGFKTLLKAVIRGDWIAGTLLKRVYGFRN